MMSLPTTTNTACIASALCGNLLSPNMKDKMLKILQMQNTEGWGWWSFALPIVTHVQFQFTCSTSKNKMEVIDVCEQSTIILDLIHPKVFHLVCIGSQTPQQHHLLPLRTHPNQLLSLMTHPLYEDSDRTHPGPDS